MHLLIVLRYAARHGCALSALFAKSKHTTLVTIESGEIELSLHAHLTNLTHLSLEASSSGTEYWKFPVMYEASGWGWVAKEQAVLAAVFSRPNIYIGMARSSEYRDEERRKTQPVFGVAIVLVTKCQVAGRLSADKITQIVCTSQEQLHSM